VNGGGRHLLPEILSQNDLVADFTALLLDRRRYYRLPFFWYYFRLLQLRNSFYLILILCFLFSSELISIPKFFESFIYTLYFFLFLQRV